MKKVLKILPQGVIQLLVMAIGNNIAYFFSALSLLIITRILGPTQFGYFSVGFAILLMLVRINDLGTSSVIQRYAAQTASKDEVNKIFSYTLKLKVLAAGAMLVLGLLFGQMLSEYLQFQHPILIFLAFFLSAATMLYEHLQAMLQSLHRFTQSVGVNLIQSSSKLLIGCMLLAGTYFGFSLPFQSEQSITFTVVTFFLYMIAPLVPVLVYKRVVPQWVQLSFSQDFKKQKKLVSSLAVHSAVGFISIGLLENIDILFAQGYLNSFEAGLLGGVSRIALIFNLLAYSLANVLNTRVAKYRTPESLGPYLSKAWGFLLVSLIGLASVLPFSDLLLLYSIGPEYMAASFTLQVLLAAAFVSIAITPFAALFFSFDAPWYFSISGLGQLFIVLVGNWMFVPVYGIEATAWVRLTARIVLLVFTISLGLWLYQRTRRQKLA